eukprot:6253326-Pyramimonas_sp.AAC.1
MRHPKGANREDVSSGDLVCETTAKTSQAGAPSLSLTQFTSAIRAGHRQTQPGISLDHPKKANREDVSNGGLVCG